MSQQHDSQTSAGFDIRFVLMGDGNQRRLLQQSAKGVQRIEFKEPLDAEDYRQVLACADVLLVNERPGVGEMAVPSKLTSYFSAGRPVLAATDADGVTAGEIRDAGAGVVVPAGDPAALLDRPCGWPTTSKPAADSVWPASVCSPPTESRTCAGRIRRLVLSVEGKPDQLRSENCSARRRFPLPTTYPNEISRRRKAEAACGCRCGPTNPTCRAV